MLRFLLGVMTDGLCAGLAFAKAGQWQDACAVLSKAMAAAPPASLKSFAVYLDGLEPDEADVRFLRSADGWLMPLATPLQKGA